MWAVFALVYFACDDPVEYPVYRCLINSELVLTYDCSWCNVKQRAMTPTPQSWSAGARCSTTCICTLIARFLGSTWGPTGADRTQVGPMSAPWTLLSEYIYMKESQSLTGWPSQVQADTSSVERSEMNVGKSRLCQSISNINDVMLILF